MLYTVTALDKQGAVLWTTDVPATCFEQAVGLATRRSCMDRVHSLTVTKG